MWRQQRENAICTGLFDNMRQYEFKSYNSLRGRANKICELQIIICGDICTCIWIAIPCVLYLEFLGKQHKLKHDGIIVFCQ